jgi:hypothetical protein
MILDIALTATAIVLCVSVLAVVQELRLINQRIETLEAKKTTRKNNGTTSRK